MENNSKTEIKSIPKIFGESIANFELENIGAFLKEDGEYQITNSEDEPIIVDKNKFLEWLGSRIMEFKKANPSRESLNYEIDQCLHCRIGNPVLIFENGKFPVQLIKPWDREKCGLMLEFENDLVESISLCFLFLQTDNPFIFETNCHFKAPKDR